MADDYSGLIPLDEPKPKADGYASLIPLDTGYTHLKPVEEPESSTLGAGVRGGVRGFVPSITSLAGVGAGATAGSAILPGVGTVAGGILGGLAGGYFGGEAQEAVLSRLPEGIRAALGQSEAQRRADIAAHPYAAMVGELAPNLAFVGPAAAGHAAEEGASALARAWASPAASRVLGAGLMGGQEAATQAVTGQEFDPARIAIAGGAGAALNKPYPWGEAVMGAGARPVARLMGERAGTEAAPAPPGLKVPDAAPDPIKEIAARMGGPPPPEGVRNEVLRLQAEEQAVRTSGATDAEKSARLAEIEGQLQILHPESSALGRAAQRWSAAYAQTPPPTAAPPSDLPEPGVPFGFKWSPTSEPQRLTINRVLEDGNVEILTPSGTTATVPANTLRQGLAADPGVTQMMGQEVPLGREPEAPITPAQEELAQAVRETAALPEILGQRVPGRAETPLTPEDEAAAAAARPAPGADIMGQRVPGRIEPILSPEQVAAQEQMGAMARDLIEKAGPRASYLVDASTPPRPPEPPISPEEIARAAAIRQAQPTGLITPEAQGRAPAPTQFTPEEIARAVELLRQQREQLARQAQPNLPEALAADIAQRSPITQTPVIPPADVAPPPPQPPAELPGRSVRGQIEQATIPGTADRFPIEYRIRDARELIPSHTVDLAPNPAADPTLQPRARDTAASEAQLTAMQNRIRPELLGEIPDATTGAPVTTPRGDVISGNGRVIMLLRSYLSGHPAAETYRNWLAEQGYPIQGIEYPVLERVIRADMDRAQLQQLARDLNVPGVAAMRASEQALADAAQIPSDVFRFYAGGDMFAAANQRFARAVLGSFTNIRDLPALGEVLSPDGQRRVQLAVLAKAFKDPDLITKLADDPDINIKAIGGALTDAAPAWAQLRTAVEEGRVPAEYDITNDLIDAARLISRARTDRRNIAEYVNQPGLFGEAGPLSPVGRSVLDWMLGANKKGEALQLAVGREKIGDSIKAYADNAQINTAGAKPSPRELTDIAREQGQGAIRELFSPQMGFEQGPGTVRPEPRPGGAEIPGPRSDIAGAEAPESGPRAGPTGVHTDTKAEFDAFKRGIDEYDKQFGYEASPDNVTRLARDYVRNKGHETGHEYYAVYDPETGAVIAAGTSNQQFTTSIRLPTETLDDPARALALHHNHPSERSLSKNDNALLYRPGIEWIIAHTAGGEIFAAKLPAETKPLVTPEGIKASFDAAAQAMIPGLRMQWSLGKIPTNDVEALATHLTNRALDAAGVTDYVSTRASDALPASVQNSIVRRAAVAARKAADEHGIVKGSWTDADYRARIDRSTDVLRPDEAIARISGGGDQSIAGSPGSPGRGAEGIDLADQTPQRANALVGGGYLDDRPVIISRAEAELNKLTKTTKGFTLKAAADLGLKVAPMAQGHWMGQAISKDFANYERGARYQRQAFDDGLKKFSQADQAKMWEAADTASVAGQVAGPEAMWEPLSKLPPEQIKALVDLDRYGDQLWERAKAVGMVKGDRLPFYTTRALVKIDGEGKVSRVGETRAGKEVDVLDQLGVNLRSKGVDRRKYLTAEETEEAGKARFGPEAELMRNIKVVPWAFERLEKAIATREMINKLKQMSPLMNKEAVVGEERSGYFTLPHPAFNTWGPRLELDTATGKRVAVRDANGDPVMDKTPIWVAKEFEGPLRAVLRTEDGALYRGAMQVKQGATHAIMISPVIHNGVEYGRAMPMMPGKVASLKVYFEGNALRRGLPYESRLAHIGDKLAGRQEDLVINPVMRKAMYEHGLVDGGHRGFLQDITGLAEEPSLHAGRGMVAKLFGGIGDVYSPEVGTKIKKAIDAAGDFFHQAMLWDRIADLKAGIYKHYFDHLQTNKGFDELTAGRTAAFLANRYSGFLPNEAMSQGARKLLNVILFSRSFKLGMAAIFKDMFTGMPRDLQAQILRDSGEIARAKAVSFARKKAINGFMVDLALFYLGNAALQTATALMFRDKSTSDVEREWLGTLQRALNRIYEHPLDALNPLETLASFSPLFENEPGKHERVWWSKTADGTNLYLRPPVGKTGEELSGWIDHPLQMLQHGASTLVRPLTNLWANDNGLGKQIYDPDAKGMTGVAANVGRVVWEFIKSQTPEQQAVALWKMATGDTREGDVPQALLPFAGLTVSRGAPGGEQQGILYQAQRQHKFEMQHAMPAIDDKIRHGKTEEAAQDMARLGLSPGLIQYRIKAVTHPETRLSKRALQDFMRYATPEQRGQMERAFEGLSAP